MNLQEIRKNAFAMPFTNPAYPKGPYHFKNREYFIISYLTDVEKLKAVVPEPLKIDENNPIVHYEFIRMPDSSGFGNYTESGQVITVFDSNGNKGNYTHSMYLDDEGPIAGGREIWGFPKKLASPVLKVETDTLIGTLNYGSVRVATGTMGFKYEALNILEEQEKLQKTPNFLLKIIPHVDGNPRICELVKYYLQDVTVKEAYTGPAALELFNHALAPVYELPILKIVGAKHIIADLTLGLGNVEFDYLKDIK